MIADGYCEDCNEAFSLQGFSVPEDLQYTKFASLLGTIISSQEDFDNWVQEQIESGKGYYEEDTGYLIIDGEKILDEFDRYQENDCKCPLCGSKNNYWN